MGDDNIEIDVRTGAADVASDSPEKRVGTVVDRYTIVRLLGRGGMGAVYEARHAAVARRFALKFLLPEVAANREVLRRFENEAKAAGGLEHPNLAAVTDFGRAADGSPYLVMEFLAGEDCAQLLRRVGPLPVPRAANIVAQACRGLAVAHKAQIIHRDLKPENLFVADAGDGSDLIKVLDFGIAKLRLSDTSVVTGTGATFGTAYYMSPEQARGAGEVDQRADVWSLGVVLYELLSGRRPFEGQQFLNVIHQILSVDPPPLGELRPGLPAKLTAVIEQAMRKDVAQRLPSVMALGEALAVFAGRVANGGQEPVRSREAMFPTMPTPGTGIQLASGARAKTSDAGGAAMVPQLLTGPAPFPRPRVLVVFALLVALGGLVALWLFRRGSEVASPASAPMRPAISRTASAAPVPVQVGADTAPGARAGTRTIPAAHSDAIAAPSEPAPLPPTRPSAPTFGASRDVRSLSDRVSDRGSIKRTSRDATRPKAPAESSARPGSATFRASPAGEQSIDIQRENPYDP
jgi:eukaryotic-like serine/threonine-protein kinase